MDDRATLVARSLAGWFILAAGAVFGDGIELQRTWRDDASLHDVQFVSVRRGWAAGGHGALWRTTDGGQEWSLVETGTTATLRSVCFLTDEIGWIAGWQVRGDAELTAPLLQATRDGGQSWETLATASLSPLKYVRFFGLDEGVVIGEPTPENVTGAWSTTDGGKTWQSLEGRPVRGWNAAAMLSPELGLLADRGGGVALLAGPQLLPSRLPPLKGRQIRDVALSGEHHGWLVGDGGLVMHSQSGGVVWESPEPGLAEDVRFASDFRAVAVKGDAVWIAGNPGGVIWHSPNGGARWIRQLTGATTPINKLHFVDASHGCAVGELGVIMTTHDGGETWNVVRGAGRHVALLAIHSKGTNLSPELLAKVSGEQGYRSAALAAIRTVEPPGPLSSAERFHEAVSHSGGSSGDVAWSLALDIPGLELDPDRLVENWNRRTEGQLPQLLLGRLVREIRTWRPHVLVIEQPPPNDAAAQLIFDAALHAVQQAGDGTRFLIHRELAGAVPWKVERIFLQLSSGNTGELAIDPFEVLPRWRTNGRTAAAIPRALLGVPALSAERPGFRAIDASGQPLPQPKGTDFFSGLSVTSGSDVRRTLHPIDERNLETLIKAAQRQRNFLSFADRTLDDTRVAGQMIAQLRDVTAEMTSVQAATTLFSLFQEYRQRSQYDFAEATARDLLIRYPDEPVSADVARWLLTYYVSEEIAWQRVRQAKSDARARREPLKIPKKNGVRPVVHESQHVNLPELKERLPRAQQVVRQIEEKWPSLARSPQVQFTLAALIRTRGSASQADAVYRRWFGNADQEPAREWSDVLRREVWLSQQAVEVPDGVGRCFFTPTKPQLDGVLSDECWQEAKEWSLAHRTTPTMPGPPVPRVMLAYDDEFLYLAASVPRIEGQSSDPVHTEGRQHDADLRRHDRLSFHFDIDRDYATWYVFEVDQRGWTAETCWENSGYNPRWYVAAQGDDAHWRTEIAIPWEELTSKRPDAGRAWGFGVTRTAPGVGAHSWARPSETGHSGPALGLLRFE